MKYSFTFLLATIFAFFTNSCSNGQTQNQKLNAKTFAEELNKNQDAILVDVRTPEEYADGHIANAVNINWNDNSFPSQAEKLDKQKTLFVYCLSGGRSASATSKLREMGFRNVIELDGGIMQWRAEGLPEGNDNKSSTKGMTMQEYQHLLETEKYVLVDFYAEWCGPCKMMKPSLEEISRELADKVNVVRIDVDKNQQLAAAMNIQGLPTIVIYKNKQVVHSHLGFASKEALLEHLK
jgi:thioredoxin 1